MVIINQDEFNRRCDENIAACKAVSYNDVMSIRNLVRYIMECEVEATSGHFKKVDVSIDF